MRGNKKPDKRVKDPRCARVRNHPTRGTRSLLHTTLRIVGWCVVTLYTRLRTSRSNTIFFQKAWAAVRSKYSRNSIFFPKAWTAVRSKTHTHDSETKAYPKSKIYIIRKNGLDATTDCRLPWAHEQRHSFINRTANHEFYRAGLNPPENDVQEVC